LLHSLTTNCLLLISLLIPVSVQAAGDWVDYCEGESFICRSEIRVQGKGVPEMIAQLRSDLKTSLDLEFEEELVELNIFRNRYNFVQYVSKRIPEGASRQALYVKGVDRARVYIYQNPNVNNDLRHECTHALIHQALPYLPIWLDEGLAEYFEVPQKHRVRHNPHRSNLKVSMFFGKKPDLGRLERLRDLNQMTKREYRDSWAWVHFLMHESDQSRKLLLDYVQDIQTGEPPGPLSKRLYKEMPNANARLVAHFKNGRFNN